MFSCVDKVYINTLDYWLNHGVKTVGRKQRVLESTTTDMLCTFHNDETVRLPCFHFGLLFLFTSCFSFSFHFGKKDRNE